MFRNQELVDRCFGFGEKGRRLLTEPQSQATIAPNCFMNFSFGSTQWNPNLVHFYSSAVFYSFVSMYCGPNPLPMS